MASEQHTVYFQEGLWDDLKEVAQATGRTRGGLINWVLAAYVSDYYAEQSPIEEPPITTEELRAQREAQLAEFDRLNPAAPPAAPVKIEDTIAGGTISVGYNMPWSAGSGLGAERKPPASAEG
jgi:hypothetical protein